MSKQVVNACSNQNLQIWSSQVLEDIYLNYNQTNKYTLESYEKYNQLET